MVSELAPADRAYLHTMAQVLDHDRVAHSADIAQVLGKGTKQLSPVRGRLLRNGMVLAPSRGELVFAVPYLADYMLSSPEPSTEVARVRAWRV